MIIRSFFNWIIILFLIFFCQSIVAPPSPTPLEYLVFAGTGQIGSTGDTGPATSAKLHVPIGFVFGNDDAYIADSGNQLIRKVSDTGLITRWAGTANTTGHTDGVAATSSLLNYPRMLAFDPGGGNLYIADEQNHVVKRYSVYYSTLNDQAGTGTAGYSGDTGHGTSALLRSPYGICFDGGNYVFIADTGNHVIRKVEKSGPDNDPKIYAVAGTGTAGAADGVVSTATFNYPHGIWGDGKKRFSFRLLNYFV
jgi:DNA-binding beta-propeller fold protein YncE